MSDKNGRVTMNSNLRRTWEKFVVVYFKIHASFIVFIDDSHPARCVSHVFVKRHIMNEKNKYSYHRNGNFIRR
jgi:hypothetical protein